MADMINAENDGDLQAQIEEVEALSSIYGDEWCVIDEASRVFCIKISSDKEEPKLTACLQIILPADYPSAAPPIYQINAAWLRGSERVKLANSLEDIYVEHAGESILYLWVEKVRDFLVEKSQSSEPVDQPEKVNMTAEEEVDGDEDLPDFRTLRLNTENSHLFMDQANDEETPPIKHGNSITDRRSTFQPHLAPVVTPRQVKMVLEKLYENKKIASATHNIYAYRIHCEDKHSFLQDCEDDGETAAGGRLLHLLFWTYVMSWWLCLGGTAVFCWALTASSTSTTVPETSWWRRDSLSPRMKLPNQEERAKGQKARSQNKLEKKTKNKLNQYYARSICH
ncbi:protein IMPACT isoform X1 [Cololabis saira]|uniref:protein IMPACT isoform X1 n=1 Tax=Cololabis saira TaxID=129043 RepID=UPI002AD49085|nr:protein IMPACT isoform X1 [Cololabis saira]